MGNRLSTTWLLCGLALASPRQVSAMFQGERNDYLAKVGPSPIRYKLESAGITRLPPLPPIEAPAGGNVERFPGFIEEFAPFRKSLASQLSDRFFLPTTMYLDGLSGNTLIAALQPDTPEGSTAAPTPAASDLLSITPEMLVDYFKPEQPPTNAVNATDRGLMDFLPASPAVWGSTAVYKAQ